MADERRRLGRGLAALLGDQAEPEETAVERAKLQRRVATADVAANPKNPRRFFAEAELDDLAASIKEKGIIQPILVRPREDGVGYEIIAGERRWRAAQRAGLHEIPVLVQDFSDREALEIAIIENVQRADLNPLEEAMGYEQLIAEFSYSQNELAQIIGKSRSHVANTLRLMKLPEPVKDHVKEGRLSAGHARALVTSNEAEIIAQRIVDQGLSVRDVETLAAKPVAEGAKKPGRPKKAKDADTLALEKRLGDALGLVVVIDHGDRGGSVTIKYKSLDQLDDISRRLEAG